MAEISDTEAMSISEAVITEIQGEYCLQGVHPEMAIQEAVLLRLPVNGVREKNPTIQDQSEFEIPYLIGSHWCSSSSSQFLNSPTRLRQVLVLESQSISLLLFVMIKFHQRVRTSSVRSSWRIKKDLRYSCSLFPTDTLDPRSPIQLPKSAEQLELVGL